MGFLNRDKSSKVNSWEKSSKQLNRTTKKILNIIHSIEEKKIVSSQMIAKDNRVSSKMEI
jgi:hypothetical protein